MDLAADATGRDALQIEDWDVMFVARGALGAVRRRAVTRSTVATDGSRVG